MNVCSEKNLQKITVDAIFKCPFDASDKDILLLIKTDLEDANIGIESIVNNINTIYEALANEGINISDENLIKFFSSATNADEQLEVFEPESHRVEGDPVPVQKSRIAYKYGSATDIYFKMKLQVKNLIVSSCLFDIYRLIRIENDDQFNRQIKNLHEELYDKIVSYAYSESSRNVQDLLTGSMYDEDGHYTGIFDRNIRIIEELLIPRGGIDGRYLQFQQLYKPEYIEAYNAFVILLHFDELFLEILGKNIEINMHGGQFSSSNIKYSRKVENKLPSTWRTNDDIDASLEIDNWVSLIMSTFNIYTDLNVKSLDRFLTPQLFIYITSKIKNLDKRITSNIDFFKTDASGNYEYAFIFSEDDFNYLKKNNISSLRVLLSNVDSKSRKSLSLIFKFLAKGLSKNRNLLGNMLYPLDILYILTIYHNMYANENSMKKLFPESYTDTNNYLNFLVQVQASLSGINYMRYEEGEDGELKDTSLHKAGNSVSKVMIERLINARFSKHVTTHHNNIISNYDVKYENGIIQFSLVDVVSTLTVSYNPKDGDISFEVYDGLTEDTDQLQDENIHLWENEVRLLVRDVLGINLTDAFFTQHAALKSYSTASSSDRNPSIYELLKFMADIISNDYFNHSYTLRDEDDKVIDKYKSVKSLKNAAKEYYGEGVNGRSSKLIFKPTQGEYGIFMKDYFPALDTLSLALSIAEGRTTKGTVKDGEGNDLGVASMARFYTNSDNQLIEKCANEQSAMKDSAIVKYDYAGMPLMIREYKGEFYKNATEFTPIETYFSTFVYDFVEKVYGDSGTFYVQPLTVADKSMIVKLPIFTKRLLLAIGPYANVEDILKDIEKLKKSRKFRNIYEEERESGETEEQFLRRGVSENAEWLSNIGVSKRLLKDISSGEIWDFAAKELGQIYTYIVDTIKRDYNKLNVFLLNNPQLFPGLLFDPIETNFSSANEYLKNNTALDGKELLYEVLQAYQKQNPNDSLVLRENMHYIFSKKEDGRNYFHANPLLISLLNRWNPQYFGQPLTQFSTTILTNKENFIQNREQHLFKDLIDDEFEFDLQLNKYPTAVDAFLEYTDWIDESVDKIYLGRVTVSYVENGEVKTSTEYIRTKKLYDQLLSRDMARIMKIELHPIIAQLNAIHYITSQLYIYATMGIPAINPSKKQGQYFTREPRLDLEEEGERFTVATKRNVTLTGNMNKYLQDSINGMPNEVLVAYIEDAKEFVYNLTGDSDPVNFTDGGTETAGPACYIQNNSLNGAKAGMDLKPLIHDYDETTASASIIKTASFGLTNERCRKSMLDRNSNRKAMSIQWDKAYDITKDYRNQRLEVAPIYVKNLDGTYSLRTEITFDEDTLLHHYKEFKVDVLGRQVGDVIPKQIKLSSLYDVYLLFGGERSCAFDSMNKLRLSETSLESVAKVMLGVGEIVNKNKGVNDTLEADDIVQPLKTKLIYYLIGTGAVKKGAGNINPNKTKTNNDPLLTVKLSTKHGGIQLDKTHEADGAHLSIMTLVINSLCAKGFTEEQANEVYKALLRVTELSLEEEFAAYKECFSESGNISNLQKIIGLLIVKELATNSDDNTTSMATAVVSKFIDSYLKGSDLRNMDIQLPMSDPSIFQKLVSVVSSTLNKTAIKMKFDGILAVLVPSHNKYRLFGGRLLDSFNSLSELQDLQLEMDQKPIDSSKLNMGCSYFRSVLVNGKWVKDTSRLFTITPDVYWEIRNGTNDNVKFIEAICQLKKPDVLIKGEEYLISLNGKPVPFIYMGELGINIDNVRQIVPIGRDLGTYNVYFKGYSTTNDSIELGNYSMWDLAIVQELYALTKKGYTVPNGFSSKKEHEKYLRGKLLEELNQLSTEQQGTVTVKVGDQLKQVTFRANDRVVQNYEAILPLVYKSVFGLDSLDDVHEISKLDEKGQSRYFKNKILSLRESIVYETQYDLELKKANGKHVYLTYSDYVNDNLVLSRYQIVHDNDELWFIDFRGKKIRRAASEEDEIYLDANNNHIIATKDFSFYVQNELHYAINISKELPPTEADFILGTIDELLSRLKEEIDTVDDLYEECTDDLGNLVYEKILQEQSNGISEKKLNRIAKRMHTSFLMSLNVLAARIPSQSMLSFMGMKTVGYDHSGINSAYVSIYLIWLQGSDYDIDTVSMLGYSFGKDGVFKHWSPYADFSNIDNLEASTRIPFPTGTTITGVSVSSNPTEADEAITVLSSLYEQIKNNHFDSIENVYAFARALKVINKNIDANNNIVISSGVGNILNILDIIDIINTHNMYIDNIKSTKLIIDITKNYISATMYDIISNPINLIQAQSPIDKAVGVISSIGNSSPKAMDVTRNTPGNAYNTGVELFNNMAGKKVTGIVAAGMKALLGITHATNKSLNEGDVDNVVFVQQIGKNTFNIVANAHTYSLTSLEILDRLYQVKNDEDAVLVLSALLSLATDNAKELLLSKINATEELVALYIAGITIGMEISDISNLMMSDVTEAILSIMKGNIFADLSSMARVDKAIRYIERGVSFWDKAVKSDVEELREAFINTATKYLIGITEDILIRYVYKINEGAIVIDEGKKVFRTAKPSDLQNLISHPDFQWTEEFKEALLDSFKDVLGDSVSANRFLEQFEKWADLKILTQNEEDRNGYNIFDLFVKLQQIGTEITATTTIQGVNQGLDTKREEIIKYRASIEELFSRKHNYSAHEVTLERYLDTEVIYTGEDATILELLLKEFNIEITDPKRVPITIHHVYELVRKLSDVKFKEVNAYKYGNYVISLTGMLNDKVYRKQILELYNLIKVAVNVPHVIFNNQHYVGYIKTADLLHKAFLVTSYKYRLLVSKGLQAIESYGMYDLTDKANAVKKAEKFFDTHTINQWLIRQGLLTVPKGISIVDESLALMTTQADTDILIGTISGNLSFKMYMELKIIPDLLKGIIDYDAAGNPIILYTGNIFLRDFNSELMDRTANRNAISIAALPINMMPMNDEEEAIFAKYKNAFYNLLSMSYRGVPVLNLLLYYNLIVHGNAASQKSLLQFFVDLKKEGNFDLLEDYYAFMSEIDTTVMNDLGYDYDLLLREIAPVKNLYRDYQKKGYLLARDPEKDLVYKLYTWNKNPNPPEGMEELSKNRHNYILASQQLTPLSNPSTIIAQYSKNKYQTMQISPHIQLKIKLDEDNKVKVGGIYYNNTLIDDKALKAYLKEYTKNNNEEYSVQSIEDLVIGIFIDNEFKVNIELTAQSLERIINDPCK